MIRHRGIVVDRKRNTIACGSSAVRVLPRDARLAFAVVASADCTLSHEQAYRAVWGNPIDGGPMGVGNMISDSIRKVQTAFDTIGAPLEIRNRYGVGYEVRSIDAPQAVERAA